MSAFELPSGWAEASGSDLFEFVRGVSYNKQDASNVPLDTSVAILRAGNLQDGLVDFDDLVYVPPHYVHAEQLLRKGDLVVAMSSGSASVVGKVARVTENLPKVAFGTFCGVLRPRSECVAGWLGTFTASTQYRRTVTSLSAGININNLKPAHLLGLSIPLAPANEQRRIVGKVEDLQSRSSKARMAIESIPPLIEKFRQSVLAAAFRGDLTKEWREKNKDKIEPASELLKRIRVERRKKWEEEQLKKFEASGKRPKDDSWKEKYKEPEAVDTEGLPDLPEGWAWGSVAELSDFVVDCPHSTPKYGTGSEFAIDTTCIAPGRVIVDRLRKVTRATFDERNRRLIPREGDIVFAREATVGTAVALPATPEVCLGQRVMLLRPGPAVSSLLLQWGLMAPQVIKQYRSKLIGTTVPHLNVADVKLLSVPIPPLEEQPVILDALTRSLAAADQLRILINNADASLNAIDQSILAKAFRGELVPQDPNDEPASVLLERIRREREEKEGAEKLKGKRSNGRRKSGSVEEVEGEEEEARTGTR